MMYDPTVFENLKVAMENRVYDLENIAGKIMIQNRADRMDFAVLGRELSLQFILSNQPDVTAEVILTAGLKDLADEILEVSETMPGCFLTLRFQMDIEEPAQECKQIEKALHGIWEDAIDIKQTLSFQYGDQTADYLNRIEIAFKPKLDEDHIGEIEDFLYSVIDTLEALHQI